MQDKRGGTLLFTIEFILPYTNLGPAVEQAFNEHPKKNEMSCRMSFIAHDRVKSSEIRGDIIIARGLTATFLNRMLKGSFTVVEIPMTGYDILRAINIAQTKYKESNMAIIATEDAIYGFEENIQELFPNVKAYEISFDSNISAVIENAVKEGAKVIIGGNEVVTTAIDMGYKGVRIETGRQGIRQAIDEAWKIHTSKLEEELRVSRLNAVVENIEEGILACNEKKEVTVCNAYAQGLLGLPMSSIIGKNLSEIHTDLDKVPFETLKKNETCYFININGTRTVVNRIPVLVDGEFGSGTIVLQKLSSIEKMKAESMISANSKGLVASHTFKDIIGESKAMLRTKSLALNYSRVNANVLLLGETGTGKELFAQSIHNASSRKSNPFVAINCAALPESLLESELFGYAEGAFTGALRGGKQGLFELADKGTIFLDEISEMSFSLQGRLLRVLAERSIRRIGHDKVIPVDVRIIAASNQDLERLVEEKKFREDLFYRLDVLRLTIPPLRARKEDIPALMENYISHYDQKNNMHKHMMDPDIFPLLEKRNWPGNVRQLRNLCERLSAIVSDSLISQDAIEMCLPEESVEYISSEKNEKEVIEEVLKKYKGNKSKAAVALNIDRSTLYRKMKNLNIV